MCLYPVQPPFLPFQFIISNLPHKFTASPFQLFTLSSFTKEIHHMCIGIWACTEARVASQEPHSQRKFINIPHAATVTSQLVVWLHESPSLLVWGCKILYSYGVHRHRCLEGPITWKLLFSYSGLLLMDLRIFIFFCDCIWRFSGRECEIYVPLKSEYLKVSYSLHADCLWFCTLITTYQTNEVSQKTVERWGIPLGMLWACFITIG